MADLVVRITNKYWDSSVGQTILERYAENIQQGLLITVSQSDPAITNY